MALDTQDNLSDDFNFKKKSRAENNRGTGSEPYEHGQDTFNKRPPLPDVHGASPDVTVPSVINHIRNLYDHMKRLVDWINEAAEEHEFTTRVELKHIETGVNEYATMQDPEAVDIILHADPNLLNFKKLSNYTPYGNTKIGFHTKKDAQQSDFCDSHGNLLKAADGGRLKCAIIDHINLSSIMSRKLEPNEFQYANPMKQQGAELNASYYIGMIRKEIIANTFKKLPVYKLPCGKHVHQGRIIQDYIDQKLTARNAAPQQTVPHQPKVQVAPIKWIIPHANEANYYGSADKNDFKRDFGLG